MSDKINKEALGRASKKGARRLVYHTRAFENRYEIPLRVRHAYRRGQRREMDIQFYYVRPDVCNNRIFDFAFHANVRRASRASRQLHRHRVDGVDNPTIFHLHRNAHQGALLQRRQRNIVAIPRERHADFHCEVDIRIHQQLFDYDGDSSAVLHMLRRLFCKRQGALGRPPRFSIPWRYSRRF